MNRVQKIVIIAAGLLLLLQHNNAWAIPVLPANPAHPALPGEVSEGDCEEIPLAGELPIYKDPFLFLPNLSLAMKDPDWQWENLSEEPPLLTTLTGRVRLIRLASPTPFKNFGVISRLYEIAEPRLKPKNIRRNWEEKGQKNKVAPLIVPIQICGEGAYGGTFGFVLLADLEAKPRKRSGFGLPPSTLKNPVPDYP